MNYTQNYHLPQWALNDRIMMDDFNQMCAGIESGLTGAQQRDDALSVRITAAQTAADIAAQTAGNAYTPVNKPYAIGSYTGTGGSQSINVGFRPSFVLVVTNQSATSIEGAPGRISATGGGVNKSNFNLSDNGFSVFQSTTYHFPSVNNQGLTYDYIAFR